MSSFLSVFPSKSFDHFKRKIGKITGTGIISLANDENHQTLSQNPK
jgi:hypothetical protein